MRIHSVEMAGFGPFLEPQRVDFELFADHGIFLVQGRTGAGKSSILDAVVYALYNGAPRYGTRAADHLRSHHCAPDDPTWVEVEFTVDRCRYRVRRSPEFQRPKARGEGLTTERATARLWRREGDDWQALEASLRTVGQALEGILPLTQTQFLQVVMLAQGQFERFLVAESGERKKLLGTLFDTRRFDHLDELLQRRVAERQAVLERASSATDALVTTLAGHLDVERPDAPDETWLTQVTSQSASSAARAVAVREAAHAHLERTRRDHEALRELQARQRRRADLEQRRATLSSRREEVERDRLRWQRALAAQAVEPGHRTHARLTARVDDLVRAAGKAAAVYEETFGRPVPEDLDAQRDDLVATIPALRRAAESEARLLRDSAELRRARTSLDELAGHDERLAAEEGDLRGVLERPLEISPEEAERTVHALVEEMARATRHADAVTARQQAEARVLEAGARRTRASTHLDDLRRRSLEQSAGRLAETLVAGEPCQVCGSSVHPAPATRGGDPVDEDDVERAARSFDEAQARCVRAEAELAAARERESAHAGGWDLDRTRTLLGEATVRHARAVELQRVRAEAATALAQTGEARQRNEVERAALVARTDALTTSVEALRVEVEEARAGAETVADRLEGLRTQLRVVEEVLSSAQELSRGQQERDVAAERLSQDLELHGFDSVDQALAALLDREQADALESTIRRHDEAWTVVVAGLDDPELLDLPSAPVDLTEASRALALAVEEHETATSAAGVARQRQDTADRIARQVRADWSRHAEERRGFDQLRRLAATVHGDPPNTRRMRLESYVLAVELEQIVHAANRRLGAVSAGRYELLLNDRVATRGNNAGLEVRVLDQHTQETRTPESLSGGEKFLASLALALGLAEVVTERAGGVTLDTLFIDEGFGSLDSETLDLAMHSLDQLREHGRTVGVISHVEAMKERMPAQLVVDRTAGGWSTVRTVV